MKRSHGKRVTRFSIGVDEVGRGPLAGPVAVCALIVFEKSILKQFPKNCDSKHIRKEDREKIYTILQTEKARGTINFSVSYVSAQYIDRHGIEQAISSALKKSLQKIAPNEDTVLVLLDGRLKAPDLYTQRSYIKGDSLFQVIGLASIAAKVCRDRKMAQLGKSYPQYGFSRNAGYGTHAHRKAIVRYGITPVHRTSFLTRIIPSKLAK